MLAIRSNTSQGVGNGCAIKIRNGRSVSFYLYSSIIFYWLHFDNNKRKEYSCFMTVAKNTFKRNVEREVALQFDRLICDVRTMHFSIKNRELR